METKEQKFGRELNPAILHGREFVVTGFSRGLIGFAAIAAANSQPLSDCNIMWVRFKFGDNQAELSFNWLDLLSVNADGTKTIIMRRNFLTKLVAILEVNIMTPNDGRGRISFFAHRPNISITPVLHSANVETSSGRVINMYLCACAVVIRSDSKKYPRWDPELLLREMVMHGYHDMGDIGELDTSNTDFFLGRMEGDGIIRSGVCSVPPKRFETQFQIRLPHLPCIHRPGIEGRFIAPEEAMPFDFVFAFTEGERAEWIPGMNVIDEAGTAMPVGDRSGIRKRRIVITQTNPLAGVSQFCDSSRLFTFIDDVSWEVARVHEKRIAE